MDFSMNKAKNWPLMMIRGFSIKPTETHHFLGVLLDEELHWHKHITYAVRKGTAYILQLCHISLSLKGISLTLARQLYTSVTLPKMLYTLDLWFKPIYSGNSDLVNRGSISTSKHLGQVQCLAAIAITVTILFLDSTLFLISSFRATSPFLGSLSYTYHHYLLILGPLTFTVCTL